MGKAKRILIATDAWYPQVNGVVRTIDNVSNELRKSGHCVEIISHDGKKTWGMPSYQEIRLAFYAQSEVRERVETLNPDFIHIATEGPIGLAFRKFCLKNKLPFTTGFHTRFADYLEARLPIPGIKTVAYQALRWFHSGSGAVLAPTRTVTRELEKRGFANVVTWTRGVDHERFKPSEENPAADERREKPILVYVGRLAVEKGIEDFLELDHPGSKLVIGDGPMKKALERKYPDATFTGYLFGEELSRTMATGDVFVFPSRTDTFGLVILEAMACGLPVAAYPVMGPIDVVRDGYSGALDEDLGIAVQRALKLNREDATEYASRFTWHNTAQQFLDNLVPLSGHAARASHMKLNKVKP